MLSPSPTSNTVIYKDIVYDPRQAGWAINVDRAKILNREKVTMRKSCRKSREYFSASVVQFHTHSDEHCDSWGSYDISIELSAL